MGRLQIGPPTLIQETQDFDWLLLKEMVLIG
jgi:hypothetical protein